MKFTELTCAEFPAHLVCHHCSGVASFIINKTVPYLKLGVVFMLSLFPWDGDLFGAGISD